MINRKKVLIIELSNGHFELIPSHLRFLKKRNYEIFYAGNSLFKEVMDNFKSDITDAIFIDKPKNIWEGLKLRKFILENRIETILLNTATGRPTLVFSLIVPSNIKVVGVMHNIEKMYSSNTQKMISIRIKDYFVLSRFLHTNVLPKAGDTHKFQYYYPIYFGNYETLKEENGIIKIVIPGRVEYNRRDYVGFLERLNSVSKELIQGIKFCILGDISKAEGPKIKSKILEYGLTDYFELYDSFIEEDQFHKIIANADYVMPLVHPINFVKSRYDKYKISGAFNLAFGHRKPLLIHESLKKTGEFDSLAVFYSLEKFDDLMRNVSTLDVNKFASEYDSDGRFDEKKQEKRFFQMIG